MTRFDTFKFLHVLFAIVWVGGTVTTNVLGARLARADHGHRVGFSRDMEFVGMRVFTPAALLTLLFGVLNVTATELYDFGQAWIVIGLGGVAISAVLGMAFLGPQTKRLTADLEQASPAAEPRMRRVAAVANLDMVVLLVVVWAMVAKPGL